MAETRERRTSDKIIGEVLASRYRVESLLGEGAMGAVYKAKHVKVGRQFAVKVLHPKLLEDSKVAQRFEREAELAGRLRHPNVVGVVDVGETTDGLRYMVMDFAEGPDLASILNEAPLPAPRVLHLTRQLLEGLYHAHEAGLIHRDFKPENVIVEKDTHGQELPKIVDFGIAILREGGESPSAEGRLTTNGLVLGTPHYMAPEQAVADPIDHRIDLFALGIVVYEMLCGKLPFDGTGAEVARANLLLDPPPISQRVPYLEVDPLLEAFSRKLMAKKREHRPATAKAARELLDLIESNREQAARTLGLPITSARVPTMTAPSTPQPRHAYDGNDTFPPPITAATANDTEVQAPLGDQPPAWSGPQARLDTSPVGRAGTAPTRAPSRRMWAFAGAGAAISASIVTLVLASGSDSPAPRTEPAPAPPVAMAATEPAETPPPAPPADTQTPEHSPDQPPVVDEPPPVSEAPPVTKKDPKKGHSKRDPKQVASKTQDAKSTQAPVKAETPAPEPVKVDATMVSKLYKQVGDQIGKLGDAGGEVRAKYRLIRIQDAFRNQQSLESTAKRLAMLQNEIAKLKK